MSVNKVILIGNVGKDPDIKYIDKNICVASFPFATTEKAYTTSNGAQIPEKTEWHNIVLWRGLAEIAEKYVRKGAQLYIEGKIRTRSWDDQNGIRRYVTEIYGDNVMLLGKRNESNPNERPAVHGGHQASNTNQTASKENSPQENNKADDLPF